MRSRVGADGPRWSSRRSARRCHPEPPLSTDRRRRADRRDVWVSTEVGHLAPWPGAVTTRRRARPDRRRRDSLDHRGRGHAGIRCPVLERGHRDDARDAAPGHAVSPHRLGERLRVRRARLRSSRARPGVAARTSSTPRLRSGSETRSRRDPTTAGRPHVSSQGGARGRAGALLGAAAADRARLGDAPRRRRRPRVPRHGQQRHAARPHSPARRGGRRPAAAPLNTNSRFHYGAVVEVAEASPPAARAPRPRLPRELRLRGRRAGAPSRAGTTGARRSSRCARPTTGGRPTDAVSTSSRGQPRALATRPEWVHTLEVPNPFRGRYRGDEARRYAQDATAVITGARRVGPTAGSVHLRDRSTATPAASTLPAGYLEAVYAEVRSRRRAGDRGRSAGRARSARQLVLGLPAAGRRARRGHGRQVVRERASARRGRHDRGDRRRAPRRGVLLLLDGRQPRLVRRRLDGSRRDPRGGSAGNARRVGGT